MYLKKISNLTTVGQRREPKFEKPYFERAPYLLVESQKSHKDYSDGVTYFETYPQNQPERQFYTSVEYERQQSQCPSIENGIIDNYLEDLKEEIRLKSQTLTKAQMIIQILKQDMEKLIREKAQQQKKLQNALNKINELQSQLGMTKLPKIEESGTKKSITKTYITQKNISIEQPTHLQLISSQIFSEFATSYQSLINDLTQWVTKQRQQQMDSGFLARIEMQKFEAEDIIYGKSDEQYSKTTLSTLQNESNKKKYCYESPSQSRSPSSYNQYEQTVDMYKEYCNKLSMLLCESMNHIQQLSSSLQKTNKICARMNQPQALLPKDLIKIVVKECSRVANRKFIQLKMENVELHHIINQMISWIQKNSKDGAAIFKSFSSAIY